MGRERRNLSLDPKAARILAAVGNGSDYVSKLLRAREDDWVNAIRTLSVASWSTAEMAAAAESVKNQRVLIVRNSSRAETVAAAMREGDALQGIASRRGIMTKRWAELAAGVAGSKQLGDAIWVLAEELYLGNEAVWVRLSCSVRVRWDAVGESVVVTVDPQVKNRGEVDDRLLTPARFVSGLFFVQAEALSEDLVSYWLGLTKVPASQTDAMTLVQELVAPLQVGWFGMTE